MSVKLVYDLASAINNLNEVLNRHGLPSAFGVAFENETLSAVRRSSELCDPIIGGAKGGDATIAGAKILHADGAAADYALYPVGRW